MYYSVCIAFRITRVNTMQIKNKKIELIDRPEYADMIINNIQVHGSDIRNPKQWHHELLYNSKLQKPARIFTHTPNVTMSRSPTGQLIVEVNLLMSKENSEKYKSALLSGRNFKIFVPENRLLKFSYDQSLQEKIRSHNRHAGFREFRIVEGFVELLGLDIDVATSIMKVTVGI